MPTRGAPGLGPGAPSISARNPCSPVMTRPPAAWTRPCAAG